MRESKKDENIQQKVRSDMWYELMVGVVHLELRIALSYPFDIVGYCLESMLWHLLNFHSGPRAGVGEVRMGL